MRKDIILKSKPIIGRNIIVKATPIPCIDYEERLIAFIDILGFKEIIRKSENSGLKRDFIFETLNFLKKSEIPSNWNLQLIEIEADAHKRNLENFYISDRTNCIAFSDSIVISVKYKKENVNESFSTLITNLSFIGAQLMIKGILLRGGITTGKTIHSDNGIIFGQGLIDAYELEKNACYPRIIISDKLLKLLNYPITTKIDRYPYHQYLKRFDDGCVGFHQMIYFQVLQSWEKMSENILKSELINIKKTIIRGLDDSFEKPDIFKKYLWLKREYEMLYINEYLKPKFYNLNENIPGHNIHFSYTEEFNNDKIQFE